MDKREFIFPAAQVVGATDGKIPKAMLARGITVRIPKFNNFHFYSRGIVAIVEENNAAGAVAWFSGWMAGRDINCLIPGSQLTNFESGDRVTVYGSLFEEGHFSVGVRPTEYTIVD